ncbi:MAG: dephospho-CoA kinase [Stagnimonas sp.]|nr:dephospho-CoA kinase [Stagnimonas sp.]
MTLVVGLTGGVASGKSHVLHLFQSLGVPAIEADDVGRAVVAPGQPALAEIAATFGAHLLQADGSLDRRAMRTVVFGDAAALQRLEALTHPHIRVALRAWLAAQTAPYCLLSAAILLERKLDSLTRRVLVVDAPEADQISRVMRRDGIDETLARQMLSRQMSRAERLAAAHDVIENPDPLQNLMPQVQALHTRFQQLART